MKIYLLLLVTLLTGCATAYTEDHAPTEGRLVLGEIDGISLEAKRIGYQTLIDDDYNEMTRDLWEILATNHTDKLTCVRLAWNLDGYSWSPRSDQLVLMPNTAKVAGHLRQVVTNMGNVPMVMPGRARIKSLMVKECSRRDP